MRWAYGQAFYLDPGASLDDLNEAVATLEDTVRIARRVLGGSHPLAIDIEGSLRNARVVLARREGDIESLRDAVAAMTPPGGA